MVINELTFEFVQGGEFEDHQYIVYDNGVRLCNLVYEIDQWNVGYLEETMAITVYGLHRLSKKLEQLNESTRKQRIFNWF